MRVTREWGYGRNVTHTFPKDTSPEIMDAYGTAINNQLNQVRESTINQILQKPVTHLTLSEQTKFYAINQAVIPYFYHELGQSHGFTPNFGIDYSSTPVRAETVSGVPVAVQGFDNPTLAITHISVEKDANIRGDMLDILLRTSHEMSHRFTYGGSVLFWNFAKKLSVQNAQQNEFEGVRRGSMVGLQFYADLPGRSITLGEALENGMAERDSRNVYRYIVDAVNTPLSDASTSQALVPSNAQRLTATEERNIRAAKNFEDEVRARQSYMATDVFKQQLDKLNTKLHEKVGDKFGTLRPEDVEPCMHARANGTFTINDISLLSYLLSRHVAQEIGAARFPGNSANEQLVFGWSLIQEGRLRNPKNAYKLIVQVFGSEKANAILTAREDSDSILNALARLK